MKLKTIELTNYLFDSYSTAHLHIDTQFSLKRYTQIRIFIITKTLEITYRVQVYF